MFAQSVKQAVEKMNTDLKSQSALLSNQTSREINPEMSSVAGTDRSDSTLAAIIPVLQQSMQVSTSQLSSHKLQAKASMPQANDYWMNNEIPSDQSKVNGQHLYYDPLHTDMDQYFEASSNTSPQFVDPQPTGAFSSLLHAHNNIIDAWGQHHIGSSSQSTGNQFASSIEGMQHHHRATMSWEEAIEKSQAMLSKGMTHPSIIINPCHSWEPFNLLDIFSDDVEAEEHDTKRQKSTHSSE